MKEKILEVIDKKIRPYLRSHKGDVELLDIEDGVVRIRLLGQCSGCISADYTVKDVIETFLKEKIPQIKKVELVNCMSEETLDMARKILGRNS